MKTCRHGTSYELNCRECIESAIGKGSSVLTQLKKRVEYLEQIEAAAKVCVENPTYNALDALKAELR